MSTVFNLTCQQTATLSTYWSSLRNTIQVMLTPMQRADSSNMRTCGRLCRYGKLFSGTLPSRRVRESINTTITKTNIYREHRQFEYDWRRSHDIKSPAAVCGGYSHHSGYSVPLIYTDVNKHIHVSFMAWPLTHHDLSRAW